MEGSGLPLKAPGASGKGDSEPTPSNPDIFSSELQAAPTLTDRSKGTVYIGV